MGIPCKDFQKPGFRKQEFEHIPQHSAMFLQTFYLMSEKAFECVTFRTVAKYRLTDSYYHVGDGVYE